ncbi:protein FAM174C [Myripristis murdjan]|uniref:Uncharacterized protein n=1 Tax=Myripristis murdjan TaxID=586833 RepID=A0A667Y9H0_9TELE|nr:uncharacterized membrane protein C19orf24 homolog [Myripristis murdjan]
MAFRWVFAAGLVPLCWALAAAAAAAAPDASEPPAVSLSPAGNGSAAANGTRGGGLFRGLSVDSSMIQRALYVLVGITAVGVLYFLVRAVRLKKPSHRKYGLLSNYEDSVELEALESDEDETLYEARSLRR